MGELHHAVSSKDEALLHEALGNAVKMLGTEDPRSVAAAQALAEVALERLGVPELWPVLVETILPEHGLAAVSWCTKSSVESIDQVVQRSEDLAASLGLKPLESKRLLKALAKCAPIPSEVPGLHKALKGAVLDEYFSAASSWCAK